jgi:K+-transporting ATPase KdpF subunit
MSGDSDASRIFARRHAFDRELSDGSEAASCSMCCLSRSVSASLLPAAFISTPAIGCEGVMSFDLILGGVIAVGMLVYLVVALLRPEEF